MSRAEEIPVEDSTSCCQLVGNSPTLEAKVGGIVTRFLVDTGSQVTTFTESFYLCGVVVPKRGILIIKESEHSDVCGLPGTNVLSHVPVMKEALRSMTAPDSTTTRDRARVVRVAGCHPLFVLAQSTMNIPARGQCGSGTAIVEPSSTMLSGNIFLVNTFLPGDSFFLKIMNRSNAGTTLTPGTRIGLIRSATLHNAAKVDVNLHEIMVNIVDKGGECIVKGNQEHFADVFARLDLAGLETQTDMDKARAIFSKHIKVSASSDGDLGCTDAVKHRITTTDDRPVSQPYRRVLPT